ncbi:DedA family protein [uncultured Kocuria sp.]|uniref:DedA family protein n=1 Tax=uncultured Kocuria sp. TaxID=259305 RepID=UPI00259906FD|nr:hypothetical protein [uncultured Kocuria sp.]MCT1367250.1 hypothetical protein [Rothia sp. p3-SID1597]
MREWIEGLDLWIAILFFWSGGIMRSSAIYGLARAASAGGRRASTINLAFDSAIYRRAEAVVHRWGVLAVPACYLTVGFQTAVLAVTGLTRMPLPRWIPAMLVGTLIWGVIYGTIGMAVVWAWLQRPWFAVLAIGVVIVAVVAVRYWRRRSRVVGDEASSELPRDPH